MIHNQFARYDGKKIHVDGQSFHACTFNGCTLIYSGTKWTNFTISHFADPDISVWEFRGEAAKAKKEIQGFHQQLHDDPTNAIKSLLDVLVKNKVLIPGTD